MSEDKARNLHFRKLSRWFSRELNFEKLCLKGRGYNLNCTWELSGGSFKRLTCTGHTPDPLNQNLWQGSYVTAFFWLCCRGWGTLVADQGSNPHPSSPTVEARSLNHWTAREALATAFLKFTSDFIVQLRSRATTAPVKAHLESGL